MKLAYSFIWISVVVMLSACHASVVSTSVSDDNGRYILCNVYLEDACFGVAGGDSLSMEFPADFSLYGVKMPNGLSAVIYSGYNPKEVKDRDIATKEKCSAKDVQCEFSITLDGKRDVLYKASKYSSAVHIVFDGVNEKTIVDANSFLRNFRSCHRGKDNLSVVCSGERIFGAVHMK